MLKYFLLLVLLYFFFILAPALSFFFSIFFLHFDFEKKRDSELAKTYYRPYRARLEAAMEFLEQQRPVMIMQRTADGITLAAEWYDQGADRTVIFLHGFRSNPRISLGVEAETMYRLPQPEQHGQMPGLMQRGRADEGEEGPGGVKIEPCAQQRDEPRLNPERKLRDFHRTPPRPLRGCRRPTACRAGRKRRG